MCYHRFEQNISSIGMPHHYQIQIFFICIKPNALSQQSLASIHHYVYVLYSEIESQTNTIQIERSIIG